MCLGLYGVLRGVDVMVCACFLVVGAAVDDVFVVRCDCFDPQHTPTKGGWRVDTVG